MHWNENCSLDNRKVKRNLEHYIVDYVKFALKHKTANNQFKFNALQLLKELMKSGSRQLTDYSQNKLLPRLFLLASSQLGDKCLLEFNKSSDPVWSANFHYLNRECLSMWGQMFKTTNPEYAKIAQKLVGMKRLPLPQKFYDCNFGGEVIPEHDDDLGLNKKLAETRLRRKAIKDLLATGSLNNVNDIQLAKLAAAYEQTLRNFEDSSVVQKMINNASPNIPEKERKLAEEIGRESVFGEQFREIYQDAKRSDNAVAFLQKYEEVNNIFFENEPIDFVQQIQMIQNRPTKDHHEQNSMDQQILQGGAGGISFINQDKSPPHHESPDRRPEREDYNGNNYQSEKEQPIQSKRKIAREETYEFDLPQDMKINKKNDYDFEDFSNDNLREEYPQLVGKTQINKASKVNLQEQRIMTESKRFPAQEIQSSSRKVKIDYLFKENDDLLKDIELLENKKRNLETKVQKYKDPIAADRQQSKYLHASYLNSKNDGAGFFNILKTKDEHIDKLADKIKKLESEYKRVSLVNDSPDVFRNSGRKLVGEHELDLTPQKDRFGNRRTDVDRRNYLRGSQRTSEQTGSFFVDQMYKDINRLLNKPNKNGYSAREFVY